MKKVLATIAAVGCLSVAGVAFAGLEAGTGVNGSLHDMTLVVGNTADQMGRVCVFCHTPHHAVVTTNTDQLPLWNHTMTDDSQFTAYTWATPNNQGAIINDVLAGPSRLCMSCHDGSIAIDQHGKAMSENGTIKIDTLNTGMDGAGRANLTKDLSNTHPIGFDYNAIEATRNVSGMNGSGTSNGTNFDIGEEIVKSGNKYASAITNMATAAGTYNVIERNQGGKKISDNLFNSNIMTCATCHEVHNKENATQVNVVGQTLFPKTLTLGGTGNKTQNAPNYFLYAKEYQSLICLSCHVK